MIKWVTQSFIKAMDEYHRKEKCGLILKAEYVDGKVFDNEDDPGAMELGTYLEWKAFGTLPKNKKEPQAVMMDSGKDKIAAYRMADLNALRLRGNPEMGVKGMLQEMGLKVLEKGKTYTLGRFRGTIDLKVMVIENNRFEDMRWGKGEKMIFDVKYSGLMESFWSKHGWRWTQEQKAYHGIQARHYHMLTGLPFYFLVIQSNNKQGTQSDMALYHYPVSEEDLEAHKTMANSYYEAFEIMVKGNLFQPHPELKRCFKCPLKQDCKWRRDFPHPVTINL